MNAGQAYEQYRLADLFIREVETPRTLLIGLDHVWCDDDTDLERVTFRGFPEWMYDNDWRNDLPYMLNNKAIENWRSPAQAGARFQGTPFHRRLRGVHPAGERL